MQPLKGDNTKTEHETSIDCVYLTGIGFVEFPIWPYFWDRPTLSLSFWLFWLKTLENSPKLGSHIVSQTCPWLPQKVVFYINARTDTRRGHVNEYPTMHYFRIPRHSVRKSVYDFTEYFWKFQWKVVLWECFQNALLLDVVGLKRLITLWCVINSLAN